MNGASDHYHNMRIWFGNSVSALHSLCPPFVQAVVDRCPSLASCSRRIEGEVVPSHQAYIKLILDQGVIYLHHKQVCWYSTRVRLSFTPFSLYNIPNTYFRYFTRAPFIF
jgi:hypothetical protein